MSRSNPIIDLIIDFAPALPTHFSEEEQTFLQTLAIELIGTLDQTEQAMARKFDEQLFDLDEGNACWSLLPAKVRTAIRRGRERVGGICGECGGLGTHTRNCTIGGRFA